MQPAADSAFLIIDNDPETRTILAMLLQKVMQSSQVAFFADSANLADQTAALSFVPDIILIDVVVRPYDGYTTLHTLRQNSLFQAAKCIAVTAVVMPPDIQKMRDSGFDGLISKPIIRQVFPQLVQRILANEPVWYVA